MKMYRISYVIDDICPDSFEISDTKNTVRSNPAPPRNTRYVSGRIRQGYMKQRQRIRPLMLPLADSASKHDWAFTRCKTNSSTG